jgi:hypothetical protein
MMVWCAILLELDSIWKLSTCLINGYAEHGRELVGRESHRMA